MLKIKLNKNHSFFIALLFFSILFVSLDNVSAQNNRQETYKQLNYLETFFKEFKNSMWKKLQIKN